MYLAKTNDSQIQAPFYIGTLQHLVEGKTENKEAIDAAIKEAKEIAMGNKTVFSISNKNYYFVTTLLTKYKNKLTTLEISNISKMTYAEIIDILT